jgi:SSS family solute:Na+ symporter
MFAQDIAFRIGDKREEAEKLRLGRLFVGAVVLGTYLLSLVATRSIFDLGVWCFSGFAGLSPLVIGALYWKRASAAGAIACVLTASGIWAILFAQSTGKESLVFGMMPVALIVSGSALALIVVSLLTTPPSAERLERFFPNKN